MGGAKPRWLRMTSPSPNGMKIARAKSFAVVRRSPLQRKDRITRPEKMSRIPLTHKKGKAVGSWIGMPNAVEAPTGLSRKLMPIPMILAGITTVHQKSSEVLLKVVLSKFVVVSICFFFLPSAENLLKIFRAQLVHAKCKGTHRRLLRDNCRSSVTHKRYAH